MKSERSGAALNYSNGPTLRSRAAPFGARPRCCYFFLQFDAAQYLTSLARLPPSLLHVPMGHMPGLPPGLPRPAPTAELYGLAVTSCEENKTGSAAMATIMIIFNIDISHEMRASAGRKILQ